MAYTLAQLRQDLKVAVGDYWLGTATSIGGAGGISLISTDLSARALTDDAYKYQWVLMTSGTGVVGDERLVSAFVRSTSTITPAQVFSAQVPLNSTFEVTRIRPALFTMFINLALKDCYPRLHVRKDYRNLVSGGFLPNDDFEEWTASTAPDFWTYAATVARESTERLYGTYSAKITGGAVNPALSISPTAWPRLLDLVGTTFTWYKYVKASDANSARLRVTVTNATGATTTTGSTYHSGGGQWEKLSLTYTIPTGTKSVLLGIDTANTKISYADRGYMIVTPAVYDYALPLDIDYVGFACLGNAWEEQRYSDQRLLHNAMTYVVGGRRYLRFDYPVDESYQLRVVGYGPFPALSAETDSVDINPKQAAALIDKAAGRYFHYIAGTTNAKDRADFLSLGSSHRDEGERALNRCQMVVSYVPNLADDSGEL